MTSFNCYNRTIDFQKCALLDERLLIGIDCGTSLTKIIFLSKNNEYQLHNKEINCVTFNHGYFKNEDFEKGLKWAKKEAYLPSDTSYSIHITGKVSVQVKDIIELIFGKKVEYIEEKLTVIAGHRIAFEKIGLDCLIRDSVEVESLGKIDGTFIKKFAEGMSSKFLKYSTDSKRCTSSPFPCLVNVCGSSSLFYYFDNEGRGERISYYMAGGTSFLGLAKCLLDTNDYNEIVQLAVNGNRGNVDTQVKDVMTDDIDSPYGRLPPDIPIFPFGKGMDYNKGLEDFAKEDVAMSLVAFFSFNMLMQSLQQAQVKKMTKVYMTGNIFQSNLFQKEIKRAMMIFPFPLEIEFLDLGYFGALGAMFCENDDKIFG